MNPAFFHGQPMAQRVCGMSLANNERVLYGGFPLIIA